MQLNSNGSDRAIPVFDLRIFHNFLPGFRLDIGDFRINSLLYGYKFLALSLQDLPKALTYVEIAHHGFRGDNDYVSVAPVAIKLTDLSIVSIIARAVEMEITCKLRLQNHLLHFHTDAMVDLRDSALKQKPSTSSSLPKQEPTPSHR